MEIGVHDLHNCTAAVIHAIRAGERVTLTVHGEPVADIVQVVARYPAPMLFDCKT